MFHSIKIKEDTLKLFNDACALFITQEGKRATQDEVIKKALGVYLNGNGKQRKIREDKAT